MLPLLTALLIFSSIKHNEAEEQKAQQKLQENPQQPKLEQFPRMGLNASNESNSTIENPGSINVTGDGFFNGTTTSESYYYTLVKNSTKDTAGDPSYTILVTKKVQVYYLTYIQNFSAIKNTQTPTSPYKYVFLHPGILVGALGGILFIIGAIYTCCFRKSASINYANYLKNNRAEKSSDSMDNLNKPTRARSGTKRGREPEPKSKPSQRPKPSTKAKASKKHRH
ncbi:hypothetical protein TVAG_098200 [Trichomonas vaginalis G3]|uniref:Uncharacterized protein n=1 Tax=Trichomonas vaginalis (strain ATCC PRA-98 / G3) TaxID=412133 RepID=A2ECA0_TRIV3|nr:hypothetical protein TVAGG3_0390320 [Trichomonas vaginalis G3]EAY09684.1 hypothetical protein TVAG_098200 [Trichomonas vaginalis G3]KAI5533941.1 hypothetical protein TVAGG3_0390320 [Trichomonas vaginalis G3]|eukprot:XP_001321907.1 hypothetical protein [Trichomonas vaginalis G3]